jgi:adenylate cyclase
MMDRPGADASDADRPARVALVVEPDLHIARSLADALRDLCPAEVVATASDALAKLQRQVPALLVTELDLPDMSGLQLLAVMRNNPATSRVIALVVTSRTAAESKIAAFEAGADDVLVKPVDGADFKMHVQMVTRFRELLEE